MGLSEGENAKTSEINNMLGTTSPTTEARLNNNTDDNDDEDAEHDSDNDGTSKPRAPMQKRRRVTRACDECRRKKIKCDGKQPCTHCTVYSYDCTYDQPSNRRRNPAPQYIESLEQRLQKAEAILRTVLPGLNIDDDKYNARNIEQILEANKDILDAKTRDRQPEEDAKMRSMVDRTGSLDLDADGNLDFHGQSSGYTFMRKFRATFGDDFLPHPARPDNKFQHTLHQSPRSFASSPVETNVTLGHDLPSRETAIELCRNTIDDCCALQRPLHRPTFFRRLNDLYNTDPENYTNKHIEFLPCLYSAMAVGSLFGRSDDDRAELNQKGYKYAMEQGYQYFNTAKGMLDITDCRSLTAIQSVMFMILFLQGTAKLSTCYAYIGVALRGCCRLGMHRKLVGKFDVIEQEERKRLFWQIRKLDIYVGAMLGLPQMLSSDDIDQELPAEVADEYIHEDGIQPIPREAFSLMKATNAHNKLLCILRKVVRYVYPVKPANDHSAESMISHSLIRELERDLQNWMDELPMQLRPSDNADVELSRVQQLLRMSYAYVQMMIYRPFLHYVSQSCQSAKADKRSFACAAACVSVARNIVHITSEMKRRGLLMGAYWFVMYTTYFAILSLLYFVLENPESNTSREILKDAMEGRDTLANLATRSMAADRCTSSLSGLFNALPQKLNERRSSLRTNTLPNTARKRPPPSNEPPFFGNTQSPTALTPVSMPTPQSQFTSIPSQSRAVPHPQEFIKNATKRMSMPNQSTFPFTPPDAGFQNVSTPTETVGFGSPHGATPTSNPLEFGTPAMVQGQLPDLKSVMFPGDNPFAYPNQPLNTLDTMPNVHFGSDTSPPAEQLQMQGHTNGQEQFPHFGDRSMYPEQAMQPQYFGMNNYSDEPGPMHPGIPQSNNLHVPGQSTEQDYWSHAPAKGQFRTGLTPGGQPVNLDLDEIFGQGHGWNMPVNMAMPEHRQYPQQQQMQWSGQGTPTW